RMLALERLDPRQEPERTERGEGGHAHPAAAARAPDLQDAAGELREPRAGGRCRPACGSHGSTARSSVWPSGEICTERVPRTKRAAPSSSSRPLICRLIADCVRYSSSAAAPKLSRRATASKARRLVRERG